MCTAGMNTVLVCTMHNAYDLLLSENGLIGYRHHFKCCCIPCLKSPLMDTKRQGPVIDYWHQLIP